MTTSRTGIGCIATTLACLLIVGSCSYGEPFVGWCKYSEPYVKPQVTTSERPCKWRGIPCPPKCGHLYNTGNHKAWADCMGVGYK